MNTSILAIRSLFSLGFVCNMIGEGFEALKTCGNVKNETKEQGSSIYTKIKKLHDGLIRTTYTVHIILYDKWTV